MDMSDHSGHQHHNHQMDMASSSTTTTSKMPDTHHGNHQTTSLFGGHDKIYFHFGYNELILFDFWQINSVLGLLGSMFACFMLAIFYEGIKFIRDHVMRTANFKMTWITPAAQNGGNNAATTISNPPVKVLLVM